MSRFFVLGIIFSLSCITASVPSLGQEILIDISHNQPVYLHDDGYAACSFFAASLHKNGYAVSVNQVPLDKCLELRKPALLILTPSVFQSHSAAEVQAVQAYVREGGRLLLFAEHENFFNSTTNFNSFLSGSDLEILPDYADAPEQKFYAEKYRPRALSAWTQKDSLIFYYPATLHVADTSQIIALSSQNKVLSALVSYGEGKMAVVADFEIIWNMSPKTGFRFGQNDTFIFHVIEQLIGKGSKSTMEDVPKAKNIWLNATCFESNLKKLISYTPLIQAFQKKKYGIKYYHGQKEISPGSEDVYIGLCACESKNEMNFILAFQHVFLSGFSKTDLWANIQAAFDVFREKGFDSSPMEASMKELMKHDGYTAVSWEDSLEIKLGLLVSRKVSFADSIHKSLVPIYRQGPGYEYDIFYSTAMVSANLLAEGYKGEYLDLYWAKSNTGTYYPAPIENKIELTTEFVSPEKVEIPLLLKKDKLIVSTSPALWRSDFSDKKFQDELLKCLLKQYD